MPINPKDRRILRDLAKRLAEVASLPVMAERRKLWKLHNSLQSLRPMILVFPEGAWRELLPEASLACEETPARAVELALRQRLYTHDHFRDDTVIEKEWVVPKAVSHTGWGLEPRQVPSSVETGAWAFDPVIHERSDLKKLKHPKVLCDEQATKENLAEARELFGDILDVKLKGVSRIHFSLMQVYTRLRGLLEVFEDMYDNPAWLHEAMSFLEEGHRGLVRQYETMDLLDLNNDGTYQASGGNGYTDELPPKKHVAHPPSAGTMDLAHPPSGVTPSRGSSQAGTPVPRVRPGDMWGSAEAQEMAQVSPAMHREFILEYEKRLLAPFGLTGYGCCEDLTRKLDYVFTIPHLRRISIAPSANVERCAEKLRGNYIFSWKPQPSMLVGDFDETKVRSYIRHTLDVTRGCVVEMILKDTHTCENHPERFTRWTEIARELVESS